MPGPGSARQAAGLLERFPERYAGGHGNVEGACAGTQGNQDAGAGSIVDIFGNAGRLTSEKEDIARLERKLVEAVRAAGREEDQSRTIRD